MEIAKRAYCYLKAHFLDKEDGGVYWLTDHEGNPYDTKKQVYAQAFALYGLAEFYDITGDKEVVSLAYQLFDILENKCRDKLYGGYFDAFSKAWGELPDTSLSDTDMNCAKTMNTNLHVMEAYTNFYRVTMDKRVKKALCDIIEICISKIFDSSQECLMLYFDRDWTVLSNINSFGHDIEASWLLCEAAELIGDGALIKKVRFVALKMAERVLRKGMNPLGGMFEEAENGKIISESTQWWVFAEAVIGFFNAYQISQRPEFLAASKEQWKYIKKKIIDRQNGEWYWEISNDGEKILGDEKVSSWKCPYHNSRMCLEIMQREELAKNKLNGVNFE